MEQFADRVGQFLQLGADLVAAEPGEAVEAQVEDRANLDVGQAIGIALDLGFDRLDQADIGGDLGNRPVARGKRGTRLDRRGRSADDLHHLVEIGDRDDQAEQHVGTLARLQQLILGAAGDDLLAEADERLDDVVQRQRLGAAAAQSEHVGREARLRTGVAPELVEHDLGGRIALQIDDDAHAEPIRFVANVADALDPLVLGGLGNALDQPGLADLEGDFGQHDRTAVAAAFLDLVARAHDDRAAAEIVGVARAALAQDQAAGGEIGAGDDLHQLFVGDEFAAANFLLDEGFAGRDHLAEIMRRDVGRHADRDAAGTVDEQIGIARRENQRLVARAVIVRAEVDRVLVDILEQHHRRFGETRFGVSHRCRKIGIHRSEIALAVDQRQPHRPILRHAGQRHVDRGIAVRMVIAHHVADDLGALAIRPAGDESALLAGVEDTAVNRLQAIADVGQSARDDDRHRIVEIARLHLVDDVDGGDVAAVDRRRSSGQDWISDI
jgi:hypothetical protein